MRGTELPGWAKELGIGAQFFLKFIAGHPAVTCIIPATTKPNHATDNMRVGRGALPDARKRERKARYFEQQAR